MTGSDLTDWGHGKQVVASAGSDLSGWAELGGWLSWCKQASFEEAVFADRTGGSATLSLDAGSQPADLRGGEDVEDWL